MISVDVLRQVYADKLRATGSHDQAFTKAVWMAYKHGIADQITDKVNTDFFVNGESRMDVIGQNGNDGLHY